MHRLTRTASGLTKGEYQMLQKLSTPVKIQDFLDALPMNFEEGGDTHRSPRAVLAARKAHCIEGAMLAATALWITGERPLIMNLSARMGRGDVDHVIALYRRGGAWGAVSKTNHAVLRFRDPIYRSLRELAASYFNEWFLPSGEKTLECYSRQLDMRRFGTAWITAEKDLWEVADVLSELPHANLVPRGNWRYVRTADSMERKAGLFTEWRKA
ncbi:MAG: hypothetical protein PHV99_03070 [Candidatus Pacebacteria bacterium]|nr:hypothetical protein [Candidatus Paceibacterota bacterium]